MIENVDPLENLYNIIGEAKYKTQKKKAGRKSTSPSKEELEKAYIEQGLTMKQIAEKYGTGSSTVHNWLKKHGIETRSCNRWKKKEEAVGMPMAVEEKVTIPAEMVNFMPANKDHCVDADGMVAQTAEKDPDTECPVVLESINLECENVYIGLYADKIEIDTVEYSIADARALHTLLGRALGIDLKKISNLI